MTAQSDLHQVTGWLADLANITAGNAPLADSKTKIASMASMLVGKFPPAAFCRASLDAVAQECRFFPPYADVMKHLGVWFQANKPPQPELPGPRDTWSERVAREHDEAVGSWKNITATEVRAKIADVQALPASTWRVANGVLLAGCLRKHAPHHLGLLPPAWLDDRDSAPTSAAASVKPHYLKPELLQAEKERLRREKQPA